MKIFALALLCIAVVSGDDAPYPPSGWKPQGALLVLPKYGPPTNEYGPPANDSTSTTPPPQDQADLDKVNESVMERLRQEEGSERGVYYVYLPDGRLQRVQYTSAPIRKAPSANTVQSSYQNNQQANTQFVFGHHQTNTQGNSQGFGKYQSGESNQYQNFAPFAFPEKFQNQYQAPSNQYRADYQPAQFNQQAQYQAKEAQQAEPAGDPSKLFAKYTEPKPQEQEVSANYQDGKEAPASYVASVQFSDVPPISGPIYSYNQSPLVRVVRYAPYFQ